MQITCIKNDFDWKVKIQIVYLFLLHLLLGGWLIDIF